MKILSLKTVMVGHWIVRCSIMNGNILIVLFHSETEECIIRQFKNEKEANSFVNELCLRQE